MRCSGPRPRCSWLYWIALPVRADDADVLAIQGDVSRQLFGNGTGVIVGIIDTGVRATHPALAGNDSQGHPRLVAAANFASDGDATGTTFRSRDMAPPWPALC